MTKAQKMRAHKANRRRQRATVPPAEAAPRLAVSGGFRAGKRKRGNSLIKVPPRETSHALLITAIDEQGRIVAERASMITYRPQ